MGPDRAHSPHCALSVPSQLIPYLAHLGVPYFYERENILGYAAASMGKNNNRVSICAFCSRMKRGVLYRVARTEKYNIIAMAHHLDDCAESFLMSALHNGALRTMKAHYAVDEGDLRVIRPLVYVREAEAEKFADDAMLPVSGLGSTTETMRATIQTFPRVEWLVEAAVGQALI